MHAYRRFVAVILVGVAVSAARAGDWPTAGDITLSAGAGNTAVGAAGDGYYGLLVTWVNGANLYAQRVDPIARELWDDLGGAGALTLSTALNAADPVKGAVTDDGMRGGYFAWSDTSDEIHVARVNTVATAVALSAPVTFANGSATVFGTNLDLQVAVGDYVRLDRDALWVKVATVALDGLSLTLEDLYPGAGGVAGPGSVCSPVVFDNVVSAAGKTCRSPRLLGTPDGVYVAYLNETDGVSSSDARIAPVITLHKLSPEGIELWKTSVVAMHPSGQLRLIADGGGGVIVVWDVPPYVDSGRIMPAANATWAVRLNADGVSVWERIDDDPLYIRRDNTATVASDGQGGLWVAGRQEWDDAGLYKVADNGEFVMVNHLLPSGAYQWSSWIMALEWDAHEKRYHEVEPSPGVFYPSSDVDFADYTTDQHTPRLVADGEGGVYVLAKDNRIDDTEDNLYAQHITSKGALLWDADQTGHYFSGTYYDGMSVLPYYENDYTWMEGAEVQRNVNPKQQPLVESRSWWGYDTFEGEKLNDPQVNVWAEDNAGWRIYASEIGSPGSSSAWGSLNQLASGVTDQSEATGTGIFTVSHERFGVYVVWTDAGAVHAAHLNFHEMWDLYRVDDAIGPGPDLFSPGPVTGLLATAGVGDVTLTWTNPTPVNSDKPFDDFDGVMVIRTTEAPALSPYDFPEDTWRDAGTAGTYTDNSVEVGVTYYYTAFAYDTTFAEFNFSPPVWTTVRVGFDDVQNFTALGAGSDQIDLTWENPDSVDYAGVEIWRDTVGYPSGPGVPGTATLVQRVLATDATNSAWSDTGLTADTKYYYSAFPLDDPVGTPYTTLGARAVAATVGPVTGLAASATATQVDLTWDNPVAVLTNGTFEGVVVCRGTVADAFPVRPDDGLIGDTLGFPTSASYSDIAVTTGTPYYYSVFAAYSYGGVYVYAEADNVSSTPKDTQPPGALTNFVAGIPSAEAIELTWTLPGDADLQGLVILRREDQYPTSRLDPDAVVVLAEDLSNPAVTVLSSSLTDDGTAGDPLVVGTTYHYSAWAYDDATPPNYSPEAQALPPLAPISNMPPGFTSAPAPAATAYAVTIDWTATDPEGHALTAVVRVGVDANALVTGAQTIWGTSQTVTSPQDTPVVVTFDDLKAGTPYLYDVELTDSLGASAPLATGGFTTSAVPVLDDDDGDDLPNTWEDLYHDGTNPDDYWLLFNNVNSNSDSEDDDEEDPDGDGLTNILEYQFGSDPPRADSDGDGITDDVEVMNGTPPGGFVGGVTGEPLTEDSSGCGGGGSAALAWALLLGVGMLIRKRRLAAAR